MMSKRVMLIEDEPLHRKLCTIWLQLDGFTVYSVADERVSYIEATQLRPDIIIADIRLPHLDGREVIRMLKARENTKHIPVIALTVLDAREDEEACYRAGANLFLNKTAGRGALLSAVRRASIAR